MQPDQGQVLPGGDHVRGRAKQLEPDQHRVDAGEEDEEPDPDQVLQPDDLVVGAEPEVARPGAVILVLVGDRGRPAGHAGQGVVEEAEPAEQADQGEDVGEKERDVVLVCLAEVVDALGVDLVAEPPAQVVAHRREDRPR